MYKIYPKPKHIIIQPGVFNQKIQKVYLPFQDYRIINELKTITPFTIGLENESSLRFFYKESLGFEAYEIAVNEQNITVYASKKTGFFYALKTLKQMLKETMECVKIIDEPDLAIRGYMIDISRNKVPTVATIKEIIDIMSDLKMNHLELYVEGFSFEYKSFVKYLEEESYISVLEFKDIEKYANERFIDLVPNQNGFGHMAEWLKQDEFKDLAEAPEGIFLWGTHRSPTTLNPLDPRSLELIKTMYKDMLPHANSKYFNMNFDEPFELGKDKSAQIVKEKGLANVYIDYTLKAYEEIKKYDKTPLIWGDVLIRHPEALNRLPKDMIFIDWGYDAPYPFDTHLRQLSEAKIPFMAAPGTASWCSFLGRTNEALATINNACIYLKQYGGLGVLLTDWGDFGHLQFLPISLSPLVYTGLLSYRVNPGVYRDLKHYINRYIFKDKTALIGDLLLDLGQYHQYENGFVDNGTQAFHILLWAVYAIKEKDPLTYFKAKTLDKILSIEKYEVLTNFFKEKSRILALADVSELVKKELNYSIKFVETLLKINQSLNLQRSKEDRIKLLDEVIAREEELINEFKPLWLARNKKSGLNKSIGYIKTLIKFTRILQGGIYE